MNVGRKSRNPDIYRLRFTPQEVQQEAQVARVYADK